VFDDVGRAVAADPAVGLHLVAHQAAQQFVDRRAQDLALDVPQRLVDAGDRAHQDRAAAVEAGAVHGLPQVVDAGRVLPDQVGLEFLDRGFDGARAAFDDGLAPADDAFVGVDFQEHPARRNTVGGQFGDFHASP
jgi:hypothetical protein